MMVIWKFVLSTAPSQLVPLPRACRVLSIRAIPAGDIYLWAAVDSDSKPKKVEIHCYPTGSPIRAGETGDYLATVIDKDGQVWHYFGDL